MNKEKFYMKLWFICLMFSFSFLVIPLLAGICLLILRVSDEKEKLEESKALADRIALLSKYEAIVDAEKEAERILAEANEKSDAMIAAAKEKSDEIITSAKDSAQKRLTHLNKEIFSKATRAAELSDAVSEAEAAKKQLDASRNKIAKIKNLYNAMNHSIDTFFNREIFKYDMSLSPSNLAFYEELKPEITIKLNCLNLKELRKTYKSNSKQIDDILEKYQKRYTTKTNAALYKLMVLALKAELQNVLSNLRYDKLDKSLEAIKSMTTKYLNITAEGNQSIAPTIMKFIGEIDYLFSQAVKIEYEYYVKKEREREEQMALREQMRQEAEEQKLLEQQRKKIEQEEEKFANEIANITILMNDTADIEKKKQYENRLLELNKQLSEIENQKEEITKLQNGKAGYVYVISNLGSFGDDVFKVGMTRRLNPYERINELSTASVPFPFDVHSFIFSEDAVSLENTLHNVLNDKRVNKINIRKEFFKISIDDLENLVLETDPTAEFNRTLLAEQYRQSLSLSSDFENEEVEIA